MLGADNKCKIDKSAPKWFLALQYIIEQVVSMHVLYSLCAHAIDGETDKDCALDLLFCVLLFCPIGEETFRQNSSGVQNSDHTLAF